MKGWPLTLLIFGALVGNRVSLRAERTPALEGSSPSVALPRLPDASAAAPPARASTRDPLQIDRDKDQLEKDRRIYGEPSSPVTRDALKLDRDSANDAYDDGGELAP